MEEQRVVWTCIIHQPLHGANNVLFRWHAHGVLLVVGQHDHVLRLIAVVPREKVLHVVCIIDTASQSIRRADVIYANQESFAPASTVAVLKRIP